MQNFNICLCIIQKRTTSVEITGSHYHSNHLRFYNGVDIDPKKGMKNPGPYKASPHENVRFFFIYHKPDKEGYVKPLYFYFEEGYKNFFPPLKNTFVSHHQLNYL